MAAETVARGTTGQTPSMIGRQKPRWTAQLQTATIAIRSFQGRVAMGYAAPAFAPAILVVRLTKFVIMRLMWLKMIYMSVKFVCLTVFLT